MFRDDDRVFPFVLLSPYRGCLVTTASMINSEINLVTKLWQIFYEMKNKFFVNVKNKFFVN